MTDEQAERRRELLSGLALRFRRAGKIDDPDARKLMDMAAACAEALLPGVENAVAMLLGGQVERRGKVMQTFEEIGRDWTSGELHRLWPDHVAKKKDTSIDEGRLKHLCDINVGGIKAGKIPIDRFTLEHAEEMMRHLPDDAKRPATRRHYALLIGRVCRLAVYPLKQIAASPLNKDFLPKVGDPPGYPYLQPSEDRKLLAHEKTPVELRIFFGFMAREGLRESEAMSLQVKDFNLHVVGKGPDAGTVRLDANKTDDARSWALDAGVTRALRKWVKLRKLKPHDRMFMDERGGVLTLDHRLAEELRARLRAAGVERHELHHDGVNTGKLRVHDLRGTFVTINLAEGKSETWVMDRTGHQTSNMVNLYRRQAREAHELGLGPLTPLDVAIPELAGDSGAADPSHLPAIAHQNAGSAPTSEVSQGYGVLRLRAAVPRRAHRVRRAGLRG